MQHRDAANWEPILPMPDDTPDANNAPEPKPSTLACPDGLDPAKWARLDRRTKRALIRHHAKHGPRGL